MGLLEIRNLSVDFRQRGQVLQALKNISFSVEEGGSLGIVGESGAGKSLAAFAIINLISKPGLISGGEVYFKGEDLTKASRRRLRQIRGNRIAMIFQDPMMTLNPVLTIGVQMTEALKAHRNISHKDAKDLVIEKLREVAIPDPASRFAAYPHELSGGMRQRIVIATALLLEPDIIIADEPTTALDVTIQSEIMALISDLCRRHGTSLIMITHDIALVSQVTQRLAIFYAGRIVEEGPTDRLISDPLHPYTKGLLACLPQNNPPGKPLAQIEGYMPPLEVNISGCEFHPRCHRRIAVCTTNPPELWRLGNRHVACFKASMPALPAPSQATLEDMPATTPSDMKTKQAKPVGKKAKKKAASKNKPAPKTSKETSKEVLKPGEILKPGEVPLVIKELPKPLLPVKKQPQQPKKDATPKAPLKKPAKKEAAS